MGPSRTNPEQLGSILVTGWENKKKVLLVRYNRNLDLFVGDVVGNIPYDTTEEQLIQICEEIGPVISFRSLYLLCLLPYFTQQLFCHCFIQLKQLLGGYKRGSFCKFPTYNCSNIYSICKKAEIIKQIQYYEMLIIW